MDHIIDQITRDGVIIGHDGVLFAMHEIETYNIITGRSQINAQCFDNMNENLQHRARFSKDNSISWAHLIVPDKSSVLREYFPENLTISIGQQYFNEHGEDMRLFFPNELFECSPGHEAPFNKVDSHPQHTANVDCLKYILNSLDIDIPAGCFSDLRRRYSIVESTGDIGAKISPKRTDLVQKTSHDWPYMSFDNGISVIFDGMSAIFVNMNPIFNQRLLMFGDSCILHLAQVASYLFREVIFCRSFFFHEELVLGCQPNIVITGQSERYSWIRNDRERPLFGNMLGIAGIIAPERREFWKLYDDLMMTRFENHRFHHSIAQITSRTT